MDWRTLPDSLIIQIERLNPLHLIGIGVVILVLAVVLIFTGGATKADNDATLEQAQQNICQVIDQVQNFLRVLEDQQVEEQA